MLNTNPDKTLHCHYDRSIYCAKCTFPIDNDIAKLDTRAFHIGCFKCEECDKSLEGIGVRTNDNKNYCEPCFFEKFPNVCEGCKQSIVGENEKFIKIKGKPYHHGCHVCSQCGCSLFKKRYHMDGGKKICQNCVAHNRVASHDMGEEL